MSTGFVYMKPLTVVCARVTGPYEKSSREAWRQIFAWLDDSNMRRSYGCGYGLMRDNPAETNPDECRYDACVELIAGYENAVPAGFRVMRLPGGAYARSRHVGVPGLPDAFHKLRDAWMPEQGLAFDPKRPFIEIYLDDPARVTDERRRVDVCVPVQSGSQRSAA